MKCLVKNEVSSKRICVSKKNVDIHDQVKQLLVGEQCDYVLITCRSLKARAKADSEGRAKGGQMEVELSFEGDPDLASYLLHDAQKFFDSE